MKLAEALSLRADMQKAIDQLSQRLNSAARIQEGDLPAEDPKDLIKQINKALGELEALVVKINRTNQETVLADGQTITEKIARRDSLKKQCQIYQSLMDVLLQRPDRYTRQEIKYVNTIDLGTARREYDDSSKRLREVDTEIHAANWQVDLIEK